MEATKRQIGCRYEGGESRDEVKRLEYDGLDPTLPCALGRQHVLAVGAALEPVVRNGRAALVAAEAVARAGEVGAGRARRGIGGVAGATVELVGPDEAPPRGPERLEVGERGVARVERIARDVGRGVDRTVGDRDGGVVQDLLNDAAVGDQRVDRERRSSPARCRRSRSRPCRSGRCPSRRSRRACRISASSPPSTWKRRKRHLAEQAAGAKKGAGKPAKKAAPAAEKKRAAPKKTAAKKTEKPAAAAKPEPTGLPLFDHDGSDS